MTTDHAPCPPGGVAVEGIDGFVLGPFETNCYVVRPLSGEGCWIVDAGFEPEPLLGAARAAASGPEALVLTHCHVDHVAGVSAVRRAWGDIPILAHEAEAAWLNDPQLNLSAFLGAPVSAPSATRLLAEGDALELCGEAWLVLHTPGHSPGGITLYNESRGVALVGDTLFAGSIGRHDFPGSDFETLDRSIREKLYTLPDETIILPGHGPASTIGREKRTNPFVRA